MKPFPGYEDSDNTALIVGLTLGSVFLVAIVAGVGFGYKKYYKPKVDDTAEAKEKSKKKKGKVNNAYTI